VPRKAGVALLADYCLNPQEASALRWACTKGEVGKALWNAFFEDQRVGIGELLALLPSCHPPVTVLLSILSPLPPRAYSIASSPLMHPCSVSIALSLVRYCCAVGGYSDTHTAPPDNSSMSMSRKIIKRSGLCTSYLHASLKRWLYPSSSSTFDLDGVPATSPPAIVRILHKPSATFRLPGSVAPPLILIGPGTGVAPFIGFLSHRAALERERRQSGEDTCAGMWRGGYELDVSDLPCEGNHIDEFMQLVPPGSVHLFFGCRNEHDWIFKVTNYFLYDCVCVLFVTFL
jgi:sulfite reductase alpha subunit-like flavoprotein